MPITDPGSVLLLGAGVSSPFGVPLGGDLISNLADQIDNECRRAFEKDNFDRRFVSAQKTIEWAAHADLWHTHPIFGTFVRSRVDRRFQFTQEQAHDVHRQISSLQALLKDQTAETIDAFIAENPQNADAAKLAIAAYILRCLYRPKGGRSHQLMLAPLAARSFERADVARAERNWIHLLINIIRHAIDNHQVSPDKKINIVSFNYDTILEHVLERQFQNRETPLRHYTDYVDIIHVHGQFKPLTDECNDPGLVAQEWAAGINVVNEHEVCDELQQKRERARTLIKEASKIYSIGFSFAGPNCRMLHLHKGSANHARQLIYCNYDGNVGVKESAARYVKARSIVERPGSYERPLSVTDFIRAGFLGEPPG